MKAILKFSVLLFFSIFTLGLLTDCQDNSISPEQQKIQLLQDSLRDCRAELDGIQKILADKSREPFDAFVKRAQRKDFRGLHIQPITIRIVLDEPNHPIRDMFVYGITEMDQPVDSTLFVRLLK